jgi:preprotein translocase subunit SecG
VFGEIDFDSGYRAMTSVIVLASALQYLFGIVLFLIGVFLILLVLVQRGRGGGLSGAFGGLGGQSAFGTKAGDTFTRITIVAATVWILVCIAAAKFLGDQPGKLGAEETPSLPSSTATSDPGAATSPGPGIDGDSSTVAGDSLGVGSVNGSTDTTTTETTTTELPAEEGTTSPPVGDP